MQRSKIDIWVGLFVLLGAAALLFLALQAGNLLSLSGGGGYQVQAQFQDIGGLKPKSAVKSSGVVVGRVKSIDFDDKTYQATVTLDMNERYHFPNDSSLKIMTSGLLGDQYIGIEAGYSDTNWKAGDKITNTQSAVVLENLIGQFMNSKALEAGTPPAGSESAEPATDATPADAEAAPAASAVHAQASADDPATAAGAASAASAAAR
ncbi:outer membrane lipid asymmetry maintenance protein MlaD [Brachymonas denitrificans]|jgi:phospholipid/cholesterol/gamma-HCH transport system substrate-binding protein|uniref:Phospholipid/cholesterol/gamma-HCH transport system substrate-binding protein n=1 Tax=Brachymonas denitrificans DSM 15123 TaxID=1121117 RepID=A0A1H8DEC6_9BURK|nr:outer membrane lipid asymmetry maintenance protein MlaD [Brachymonas denitrificans]SEN05506.1 phospholipid/cholesterol/gamma-HCH transport system substrate-binding protein [Brachymonas denitrificans DSM 15123]